MTDMTLPLDCEAFEARIADLLEGDLAETAAVAMETHAASCIECGALLADLGGIRQEAAALPALVPSRDLWTGIAERIDARVVPLDAARRVRVARRAWLRPAAAAAAIMIVTAGITHVLTRASYDPSMRVAATGSRVGQGPTTQPGDRTPAGEAQLPQAMTSTGGTGAASVGSSERESRLASSQRAESGSPTSGAEAMRSGRTTARLASTDPLRDAEPVYDREITKLRSILRERRSQLDPKTVAVLEQSIAVIDSAIAQSRRALAKDPASGFLATQLNHSLEQKVELLRTAALLPART